MGSEYGQSQDTNPNISVVTRLRKHEGSRPAQPTPHSIFIRFYKNELQKCIHNFVKKIAARFTPNVIRYSQDLTSALEQGKYHVPYRPRFQIGSLVLA